MLQPFVCCNQTCYGSGMVSVTSMLRYQSPWKVDPLRDLFHVYFNRCEFHFMRLHKDKTNKSGFIIYDGRVPAMII